MNKINKSILALMVAVLAISSCTDFVDPAIPYSGFDTGVFLRTIKRNSTSFELANIDNAVFSVVVEVVDEEGGKLIQDVAVLVKHRRGNVFSNEVAIRTIPASEFGPYAERDFAPAPDRDFPAHDIKVTATETLSKLGMSKDAVAVGDFFEYRLELHDTKGRTFTNTNVSIDIASGAFYDSPFLYRVTVK